MRKQRKVEAAEKEKRRKNPSGKAAGRRLREFFVYSFLHNRPVRHKDSAENDAILPERHKKKSRPKNRNTYIITPKKNAVAREKESHSPRSFLHTNIKELFLRAAAL